MQRILRWLLLLLLLLLIQSLLLLLLRFLNLLLDRYQGMKQAINTPRTVPEVQVQYEMNRNIQSVEEVWCEWHSGFNGGPAIVSLDTTYGNSWRSYRLADGSRDKKRCNRESKFYGRRKKFIDWIKRVEGSARVEKNWTNDFLQKQALDTLFGSGNSS
jgi:hypothetical protein